MSNEPSKQDQTVFVPPVSAFSGPIAELVGHRLLSPPTRPGPLASLGQYEVVRILGGGGMGIVLLARDISGNRNVAVKMVRPELVANQQIVHRFVREAGHLQKLKHKNVAPVLEVSDRPEGPYFVMPYFENGSLAHRIQPGEPLDAAHILEIAAQVAAGLQFAHRRGIIHRDLKPANILLGGDGLACLADFGLARTMFNDTIVDVEHQQLEGTAPYMSPGVAAGNAEDTRCDIYAFGALLYEMLTGEPPYVGRNTKEIRDQILKGPPKPIKLRNPAADSRLTAVAEGAMARELRDRYADMSDIVADLERINSERDPLGPRGLARRVRKIPASIWIPAALIIALVIKLAWPGARPKPVPPTQTPTSIVTTKPPDITKPAQSPPAPTVAASGWVSPIVAGAVGQIGHADGPGADARFCSPSGIAIDRQGNLFVADMGNNTIRKITPDHIVTTLAGLAGAAGIVNAQGSAARFIAPQGIAVDQNDTVYVAEFVNNTVRKITSNGNVSLLAGASVPGSENGRGTAAHFRNPWALAVDTGGNVYVSDNGNHAVRKISPDGSVITLSDSFTDPRGIALDAIGNIYVADIAKNTISRISTQGKVSALPITLSAPESLSIDPQGLTCVVDAGGIGKFSHSGKILGLPPLSLTDNSTPFAHADSIAIAADGTLYIADSINNVICKYPPPTH